MGIEVAVGAVVAALSNSVAAFAATFNVAQILLTATLTAASFASSLYSAQQQKAAARKAALGQAGVLTGEGAQETVFAQVVARRTLYGEVTTGGVLLMPPQYRPPYQYLGLVLAAHPCDSVVEIRINRQVVRLDANNFVVTSPFMRPDGVSLVKLSVRLGDPDQLVDPIVREGLPEFGPAFRHRGCTTLFLRLQYGRTDAEHAEIFGSELKVTVRLRGKKVYDPRDPAQIWGLPATYRWSDSPTLCCADYSVSSPDVGLDPALLDWATIGRSASIDGGMVQRRDGQFERRYTVNGIIDTDAEPPTVIRNMLAANRGRPVRRYGLYGFMAGAYTEPVMTIDDSLIAGAIDYRADSPRRQRINVLRSRMVAPEREYRVTDGPVLVREDYIEEDEQRNENTLPLEFVEGAPRAQRLVKAHMEDQRRGRSIQTSLDIRAFGLEAGDTVRRVSAAFPHHDGLYTVEKSGLANRFTTIPVSLVETSPDILFFDPQVDESPFTFALE